MPELSGCPSCQGFNPPSVTACLHCRHPLDGGRARLAPSWVASLWTLAGASATALTLMACYGMPPCEDGTWDCHEFPPNCDLTDAGADAGLTDGGGASCIRLDAGTTGDAGTLGDAGSKG
ncbi:hypothetical protein [Pyxidicoccus trucidator]|uniref:hypothetical protein n=1 Tax=Pyxidicoccus trucidator TaxID=2709662 RepID=UPI001966F4EA|nr:hypothetical protein [Pyxidicoccus trucidator]